MNNKLKLWFKEGLVLASVIFLAILLGNQIPKWYSHFNSPFKKGDFTEHIKSQPYSLTLYGTSTCPHCESARKFLTEEGIPFNDVVIDKSQSAENDYKKLKENVVPILVSKDKLIIGFRKIDYAEMAKSTKTGP